MATVFVIQFSSFEFCIKQNINMNFNEINIDVWQTSMYRCMYSCMDACSPCVYTYILFMMVRSAHYIWGILSKNSVAVVEIN